MRLAAIDIGSNSIKLLVAERGARGTLIPLRREKAMVRLGHETLLKEHLSSEAIVMAIRTITVFKSISESLNSEHIFATATASVREADNANQFIREVENRTGIRIEVLSGVEEARLIGVAAASGSGAGNKTLINIDIGGGSTEISLMRGRRVRQLHSMKIGAVRLTERYLANDPPKEKELTAMRREIEGALERPLREMKEMSWEIATGTSGTILSIGAALESMAYPETESAPQALPNVTFTRRHLSEFNSEIAELTLAERKKLPGISDQRAEIVIAGGQILEQTMQALRISKLTTCNWSLREGVLLDRLAEMGDVRMARAHESDVRLAGAEALGERFGYEAAHGKQVSMLSCRIFDQIKALHGLGEHDRALLAASAILHDIGYAISHDSHHKHSLYLINNSELTGFTDLERLIIANIARYHRKSFPRPQHPEFATLPLDDQGRVWMLGGILRLADAMDRSHLGRVKDVKCIMRRDKVLVELRSSRNCDHEIWAIEKKKDMFEEAFGVPVELVQD